MSCEDMTNQQIERYAVWENSLTDSERKQLQKLQAADYERLPGESVSYAEAIEITKLERKMCTCFTAPCRFHGVYTDGTEIDPYGPDGVYGEYTGEDTRPAAMRGTPLIRVRCKNCRTRQWIGAQPVRCWQCGRWIRREQVEGVTKADESRNA